MKYISYNIIYSIIILQLQVYTHDCSISPAAADDSGVHASTIIVDRDGGTPPSPVGRLAIMPVEDAPGECGRKTDVGS